MTSTTMEVDGAENLARTMRRAAEAMQDMPRPNASTAGLIARTALGRVPRRSGALASSIRAETVKAAAVVYAGSYSVPYAGVIQYGWPAHNISAQPFLTDALSSTEPQWLGDYEREVQRYCSDVRGA